MASRGNCNVVVDDDDDLPSRPTDLATFLDHFLSNHRDDNFIAVKHGNYYVSKQEIVGEVVDWTIQYLQYMSCPASLEASLTRAVLDEAKAHYLTEKGQDQVDASALSQNTKGFRTLNLLQNVTASVNEVCRRLKSEAKNQVQPSRLVPCSVGAVKNGRRKMEDRHVVIHDINAIYTGHANQSSDDVDVSFYGVYDGHAGRDAAAFAASHLHGKIFESPFYPVDPVSAIKDAFHNTDAAFLDKGKSEDLRSGTTAVVTLIRGSTLYTAWLGDSQAVLVRNGIPIKIVEPHKPNRKDEKFRIESLGGTVIFWGTWRVSGQLAVSRAIGDGEYKPYVSSDPDVTTIQMNGSEDFIIIACDGLWDTVTLEDATNCVLNHLRENKDNIDSVSQKLITLAKDNGSSDNITIVVVFLKPIDQLISDNNKGESSTPQEKLYEGITSTCSFIMKEILEGKTNISVTHDNMTSPNPFTSPGIGEIDAFTSPDGGGFVCENPFADLSSKIEEKSSVDGDASMDAVLNNLNSEKFNTASPSLFENSSDFEKNADRSSSDFMANQESSWISSGSMASRAVQNVSQNQNYNPFAPKSDSGFISPACTSNNHSASSEDSAENHDERLLVGVDELTIRAQNEVTKLLGGGIETQFGELMLSARNETPTPPVEDTGDTLEDILAACRDKPDSIEDDDQETDTSEDDDQIDAQLNIDNHIAVNDNPDEIVSSDSDGEDEGFTFLKQDVLEKPEIILKSALTTENELFEMKNAELSGSPDSEQLNEEPLEENEPLVSQCVDQKFIDQMSKSSNVVDLTENGNFCLVDVHSETNSVPSLDAINTTQDCNSSTIFSKEDQEAGINQDTSFGSCKVSGSLLEDTKPYNGNNVYYYQDISDALLSNEVHAITDSNHVSLNLNEEAMTGFENLQESIEKCVFDQQEKEKHQNFDLESAVEKEAVISLEIGGTDSQVELINAIDCEEKEVTPENIPTEMISNEIINDSHDQIQAELVEPLLETEKTHDCNTNTLPEVGNEDIYSEPKQETVETVQESECDPKHETVDTILEPEMINDLQQSSVETQSGPSSVIVESQEVPIPDQASFIMKPSEPNALEMPTLQEAVVEVIPETVYQSPIFEESEEANSDTEEKASSKSEVEHSLLDSEKITDQAESGALPLEDSNEEVSPSDQIIPETPVKIEANLIDGQPETKSEGPTTNGTDEIVATDISENILVAHDAESAGYGEVPLSVAENEPEDVPVTEVVAVAATVAAVAAVSSAAAVKKSDKGKPVLTKSTATAPKQVPGKPIAPKTAPVTKTNVRPPSASTKPPSAPSLSQKSTAPKPTPVQVAGEPPKKAAPTRPLSAVSRAPPTTTSKRPIADKKEIEKKQPLNRPSSAPLAKPPPKSTVPAPKTVVEKPKVEVKKPVPSVAARSAPIPKAAPAPRAPPARPTSATTARPPSAATSRPPSAATSSKASAPRSVAPSAPKPAVPKTVPVPKPALPASPAKSTVAQARKPAPATTSPTTPRGTMPRTNAGVAVKQPTRAPATSVAKKPMVSSSGPKPTDLTKKKLVKKPDAPSAGPTSSPAEPKVNGEQIAQSNGVNGHHTDSDDPTNPDKTIEVLSVEA